MLSLTAVTITGEIPQTKQDEKKKRNEKEEMNHWGAIKREDEAETPERRWRLPKLAHLFRVTRRRRPTTALWQLAQATTTM